MSKINPARYRRRADEASARKGAGGRFLQLKDGDNKIRLLTFKHQATEFDFACGRYTERDRKEGVEVGQLRTELDEHVVLHFVQGGPVANCTQDGDCPVCEDVRQIRAEEGRDSKRATMMAAQHKYVFNAVDTEAPEPHVQLLKVPTTVYEQIMEYMHDPEVDLDSLYDCKGRDFLITRNPERGFADMYSVRLREPKFSPELPKSLESDTLDLYGMKELLPGYGLTGWEPPEGFVETMGEEAPKAPKAQEPEPEPEAEEKPKAPAAKPGPKRRGRPPKAKEQPAEDDAYGLDRWVSWDFEGQTRIGQITSMGEKPNERIVTEPGGEEWDLTTEEAEPLPDSEIPKDAIPF